MTKVLDKQNIFDLVLQETGGLNLSASILHANGLNFTSSMVPGAELSIRAVEAQKVKDNYILNRFNPNNAEILIVWILEGGVWNDAGVWIDSEFWQD